MFESKLAGRFLPARQGLDEKMRPEDFYLQKVARKKRVHSIDETPGKSAILEDPQVRGLGILGMVKA